MYLLSFWENLHQDGSFYAVLTFLLATIIIVTWLYARTRSAQIIAQLKTQLLEVQAQYNDRIFAAEDEARQRLEHLRLILQDLRNQLVAKNSAMILARRNEAANFLVLEYAKSVRHYARIVEPFLRDNRPQQRQFLENHILPFLQQSGDVLQVLNQPEVLRNCQAQPLALFYPDFDFAFDSLRHYAYWWDFGIRQATHAHAQRLGF